MNKNLRGCLKNVPCFIIGNGPSLNDHDLSLIDGYFTLGINRAYLKIDPCLLIFQDDELLKDKKLFKTKCLKLCKKYNRPHNNFFRFKLIEKYGFKISDSTKILYGNGATAPLAFQVAYALGCDPIVLLGMDCKESNGITNFYGNNKYHNSNTMKYCLSGLKWIKDNSGDKTIINCSDNSFWEKASLEDAINRISKKWEIGKNEYIQVLLGHSNLSIIRNIESSSNE